MRTKELALMTDKPVTIYVVSVYEKPFWFEDKKDEYMFWVRVFWRLRN